MDAWKIVKHYPTGVPVRRRPKHVVFGEEGDVIVGRSDHGKVYVFDRKTGAPLEVLSHSASGMVQAVAVSDLKAYRFRRLTSFL
jgi:hypothetical protein